MLTVICALGAAFCNASWAVLARLAGVAAPAGQSRWQVGWYLVRQPVWLVGQAFAVGVFVLSGVALYFGELAVVQPLLVVELIFALALREFRLHDVIPVKSWYAASLICLGLAGFLVAAKFHGGTREPKAWEWAIALTAGIIVAGGLLAFGRRGSPARRASCIGAAAAVVWAIDASFVKKLTDVLQVHGVLGAFDHWPLYALVVSGILGAVLTQAAFNAGPLSASQPALLIVDPLASIILGLLIFGEHLDSTGLAVVAAGFSILVVFVGVVLMSRWAPPSLEAIEGDPLTIMRYGRRPTVQATD
ncbi:MAG: DMT family transporter [Solirubrobacteraceae bacterium]